MRFTARISSALSSLEVAPWRTFSSSGAVRYRPSLFSISVSLPRGLLLLNLDYSRDPRSYRLMCRGGPPRRRLRQKTELL